MGENELMDHNKKAVAIFIIFLIQGILGLLILSQYAFENSTNWRVSQGTLMIYGVINLVGILGVKYIMGLLDKDIQYQKAVAELQKSDEVVTLLRAHKHDFFNHLQVISGLAQLNKSERIVEYIQTISQSVNQSYEMADIHIPEIAIVLMQKLGEASNKGIQVETKIESNLEGLKGSGVDYAQILFNLLDNAIYELDQLENVEKRLRIELTEEKACYQLVIYNNLPIITPEHIDVLFKRGFSTKQGEHDGLGLWNVERLVQKNKGIIKVKSLPEYGTAFNVIFPK